MAEWVPMRGDIYDSPKLRKIAMAMDPEVESLIRLGDGDVPAEILRYMAIGMLARLWTRASQVGTLTGSDLILEGFTLADLDEQVGLTGFGEAMRSVGWAKVTDKGVRLPHYTEHGIVDGVKVAKAKRVGPTKPRPRNPLYDAIAEVTGADVSVEAVGKLVGKVSASLAKASPPYTPEEVREFRKRFLELCPWAKGNWTALSVGVVEKHIHLVRAKKAATKPPTWVPPEER